MDQLRPSDIRFTHDSISYWFGNGSETIEGTFKELLYGEIDVEDIRPLTVDERDGLIWVISGNRRLYVFQKLEEYGRIDTIPVNFKTVSDARFDKCLTTKNDGESIVIRGDHHQPVGWTMEDRLDQIYQSWRGVGCPAGGVWTFGFQESDFYDQPSNDDSDDWDDYDHYDDPNNGYGDYYDYDDDEYYDDDYDY